MKELELCHPKSLTTWRLFNKKNHRCNNRFATYDELRKALDAWKPDGSPTLCAENYFYNINPTSKLWLRRCLLEKESIDDVEKELLGKLNEFCYGYDGDTIQRAVYELLAENDITISIAESCTGGLIAKKITDIDGSSNIFHGGVVAYSNQIKNLILKVPNNLLNEYGAVSREVASLMAKNVAKYFKSDLGVSVTGISGPDGGTDNKPVGLYYVGISFKDQHFSKKFISKINDREINREISSDTALNLIRLTVKKYYE